MEDITRVLGWLSSKGNCFLESLEDVVPVESEGELVFSFLPPEGNITPVFVAGDGALAVEVRVNVETFNKVVRGTLPPSTRIGRYKDDKGNTGGVFFQ